MSTSSAVEELRSMLGSTFRVTINTDTKTQTTRTFLGTFSCIDKQGNLVLEQTTEYYYNYNEKHTAHSDDDDDDDDSEEGTGAGSRQVGMVLIPKKHWNQIQLVIVDNNTHSEVNAEEDQQQQTLDSASSCAQS